MLMSIFDFLDYRDYLKSYFQSLPQKGYGKFAELSEVTNVNPATVSLVLKKERDFTIDQAYETCLFLGLGGHEIEYFMTSVNLQKAAKTKLKNLYTQKLSELKKDSLNLQKRLSEAKELDENAKAQFYSNWFYSAVRLATSIPEMNDAGSIAKKLNLPLSTVTQVLNFLKQYNLVKESDGKLKMGAQTTHLGANSNLVNRHHTNWRLRGIGKMDQMKSDEMFFTSPLSIAEKDIPKVREILIQALGQVFKVVDPSKEENLACINIDWFRI
jgi:uncharacterized protein (TIGR02147 family)